jgi:hypothetical protein
MAAGSTQPVTEMSTRNLPGVTGRPARRADNFTAFCEPIVRKIWEPRRHVTEIASPLPYQILSERKVDDYSFPARLVTDTALKLS